MAYVIDVDDIAEVREELLREYLWRWASAAHRQIDRSLSQDASPSDRLFDAFLAVHALKNAHRAARALLEMYGEQWFPAGTLERFDEEHPDITTVRDILEHFDDYVMGTGNLQIGPRQRRRGNRRNEGLNELASSEHIEHEPVRVGFDEEEGVLKVGLSTGGKVGLSTGGGFAVNLSTLRDDLAHMIIDFIVDLDALEDETHLFDEQVSEEDPALGERIHPDEE